MLLVQGLNFERVGISKEKSIRQSNFPCAFRPVFISPTWLNPSLGGSPPAQTLISPHSFRDFDCNFSTLSLYTATENKPENAKEIKFKIYFDFQTKKSDF